MKKVLGLNAKLFNFHLAMNPSVDIYWIQNIDTWLTYFNFKALCKKIMIAQQF